MITGGKLITKCPPSEDGMERFACPTPDRMGRYRCIDDHVLCNGFFDCPLGEDEDRQSCMFYKTVTFNARCSRKVADQLKKAEANSVHKCDHFD
ncbi:hypothetical protein PV325_010476 [Microctonus aethiopoides]|nr:hypothetical protein PV325_010476 [Microctonus aethiopoides]